MREVLNLLLDITPTTWGSEKDPTRRENIRKEIRKQIPEFGEKYISNIINSCQEIELIINCYLPFPETKDIDNLAKIPMDAVLFSAYKEIGYTTWEAKVTSLIIKKIKSPIPKLEIIIRVK
jgi:Holliday junction resolvase RusA-like endonuclease